jgi:hypothetical protein
MIQFNSSKIMKTTFGYACLFTSIAALILAVSISEDDHTIDREYDGIELTGFILPNLLQ